MLALAVWAENMDALQHALDHGADEAMKSAALDYAIDHDRQDMFAAVLAAAPADKTGPMLTTHFEGKTAMFEAMWDQGLSEKEQTQLLIKAFKVYDNAPLFERLLTLPLTDEMKNSFLLALAEDTNVYGGTYDEIHEQMLDSFLAVADDIDPAFLTAVADKMAFDGNPELLPRIYPLLPHDAELHQRLLERALSIRVNSDRYKQTAILRAVLARGLTDEQKQTTLLTLLEEGRLEPALLVIDSGITAEMRQAALTLLTDPQAQPYWMKNRHNTNNSAAVARLINTLYETQTGAGAPDPVPAAATPVP